MSEKPGVMIYFDVAETVELMSDELAGALFKAILEYGLTKREPALRDELIIPWPLIRAKLDVDDARYFRISQKRRYAAYARWAKHHCSEVLPFDRWLIELDRPDEDDYS